MMQTGRIRICPASTEEMERILENEQDPELRKAYGEMLAGSLSHGAQWEWYAMWRIEKPDGTPLGDLCFKGLEPGRNPEIGYGILEAHQGRGYATEAVGLALQWAFGHPEVCAVEAETEPDNAASQRVLQKCGFRPSGEHGEEGPRFRISREDYVNRQAL